MEIINKLFVYKKMKLKNSNPIANSICFLQERFQIHLVLVLAGLILLISGTSASANTPDRISFSWTPNPHDDYVIGYRLYYSAESRFDSNGKQKSNFSYDYYIDLTKSERCVPDGAGTECKILTDEELRCDDLYGDSPKCSIDDLEGDLHLAMTAYNLEDESNYTQELYYTVTPNSTFNTLAAVQVIQALLLH